MTNRDLLIKLRGLHEDLSTMNDDISAEQPVDEETIEALGQLITDVNNLVDQARETTKTDEAPEHDMLDRISQFETHHPRVTSFLSQVTDILAMMGI